MITYILLYIGIYIFLCFGVWFIQRRSDGSRKLPPLEVPTETPNPYEFAALRAGRHEIVRLFLFELIATGLIALTTDQKGKVTKQSQLRRTDKEPNEVPELSPEGQYFFSWFAVKRAPSFVFDSSPLQSLAEQWTKKFNIRFDEERLVLSRHGRCISWITLLCAIVLSFGVFLAIRQTLDLGQANFFVGAFFFTFAGWVAGTIVLALVFIPRKLSYRGKRYVKAVQEHFRP
ncbi:MAG: TIGR04222 domain-containing membrane protein, partial [Planctomycetaceae bacterium]|nr:TIGR04222 domain-containing membrane protein [Planctomycetaceae bacterium]